MPTANGAVKAQFEFDMFGVGGDAGQTTIRLRHAWGQWKQIGARPDQQPVHGRRRLPEHPRLLGTERHALLPQRRRCSGSRIDDGSSNARIAIEAPGASGDAGVLADRVELQNVKPRFPSPDFTGHYRLGRQVGLRPVRRRRCATSPTTTSCPNDAFDLSGSVWGWGVSVSSNLKLGTNDVLRLQLVDGAGVENYFNDAPVDVGVKSNPGNAVTPVVGEALHDLRPRHLPRSQLERNVHRARSATRASTSPTATARPPTPTRTASTSSATCSCTPAKNVMMGGEFQWAHRENNSDGFAVRRRPRAVLVQVQLRLQDRRSVMVTQSASHRGGVAAGGRRPPVSWSAALRARRAGRRSAGRRQRRVRPSTRT